MRIRIQSHAASKESFMTTQTPSQERTNDLADEAVRSAYEATEAAGSS